MLGAQETTGRGAIYLWNWSSSVACCLVLGKVSSLWKTSRSQFFLLSRHSLSVLQGFGDKQTQTRLVGQVFTLFVLFILLTCNSFGEFMAFQISKYMFFYVSSFISLSGTKTTLKKCYGHVCFIFFGMFLLWAGACRRWNWANDRGNYFCLKIPPTMLLYSWS